MQPSRDSIHGYDYDTAAVGKSPVSLKELRELEETVTLTAEDQRYLELAGRVFEGQEEALVAVWRAVIASQPHLAKWFLGPDGQPDEVYKAAVKKRFVQWVLDTCRRPRDQAWLDYQEEIALRHTPAKKNLTDGAQTAPIVPLRYLIAFAAVITTTVRPFLCKQSHGVEEVGRMEQAWNKAVMLQIALWSRPYTLSRQW